MTNEPSPTAHHAYIVQTVPETLPLLPIDPNTSSYSATSPAAHPPHPDPTTSPSPPSPRRASWLAILILPARFAATALSFAAGAALSPRPLPNPLALLTGFASATASHYLVRIALAHHNQRIAEERAAAESAREQRIHWLDAIQAVGKIVDRFSSGLVAPRTLATVFLDAGLARLLHAAILRRRLRIARNRARTRTDVLIAARRYLDFALATYGFILLKLLGVIHSDYNVAAEGSRPEDVARYILRIPDDHILHSCLDGEGINVPRHFVALDTRTEAVVVAIRGTNSISDIITDLICGNEPFVGGYAHAGMKSAAESLRASLLPVLRDVLTARPHYSVVITGHSMGAGVAILLTKLLLMDGFVGVKCFAFAPCPVFGPMHRVDSEWSDALECFVHIDDLVSRLCLSSARRLALEMEQIHNIGLSHRERKNVINNQSAILVEDLLRRNRQGVPDPREKEVDQLYIPTHRGIHWLIPEEEEDDDEDYTQRVAQTPSDDEYDDEDAQEMDRRVRQRARNERRQRADRFRREVAKQYLDEPSAYVPTKRYGSYIVRPRFFERILVTAGCVNAHFPNCYTAAIAGLDLPPDIVVPLPKAHTNYSSPWYGNELGFL